MRLDEQGSAHPLELEEPVGISKKRILARFVDTHAVDISRRTQVAFHKEEVGL